MKREHLIPLILLLAGAGYWYYTKRTATLPLAITGGGFPMPSNPSSNSAIPLPSGNVVPIKSTGTYGMTAQARGIRNNNPGNIKITSNAWKGKVTSASNTDGVFEQFDTPEYGIRALYIDLRSKINRGLNTIEKIIAVYAPTSENNTFQYVTSVSAFTGIPANKVLNIADIRQIIPAIIKHENGFNPYSAAQLAKAISMV